MSSSGIDSAPCLESAQKFPLERSQGWENPLEVLARFGTTGSAGDACDWYRIADGYLGIESDDRHLWARFRQLYRECLSPAPSGSDALRSLYCRVRAIDGVSSLLVTFAGPEPIEIVDFMLDLFGNRGYAEQPKAQGEWRAVALEGRAEPLLLAKGNQALVAAGEPWQPLIANCAFNWALRIQREVLFFHAASVGLDGAGILITGPKGAGKSTLSMALAARGHDFLGDEIAAIRTRSAEILPVRRAVSIRPGPQASKVEQAMREKAYPVEKFPDGTTRFRAEGSEFFSSVSSRALPLLWVFFLAGFEDSPRAEAFVPRTSDLRLLSPLGCTFWGESPMPAMMRVAKLLANVNCYFLHPGMPDDTARLVETIVRQ